MIFLFQYIDIYIYIGAILQEYNEYTKTSISGFNKQNKGNKKKEHVKQNNRDPESFNGIECILDRNIETSFPLNLFFSL